MFYNKLARTLAALGYLLSQHGCAIMKFAGISSRNDQDVIIHSSTYKKVVGVQCKEIRIVVHIRKL